MVQVLPADQPFDTLGWIAAANPHPLYEVAYVPAKPFVHIGAGGSGSQSPAINLVGYLSDAPKREGLDYIEVSGTRIGTGGSGDTELRCFAWHDEDPLAHADLDVTATFRYDQAGSSLASTFEPESQLLRTSEGTTPGGTLPITSGTGGSWSSGMNAEKLPIPIGGEKQGWNGAGLMLRCQGPTYAETISPQTPASTFVRRLDHYFLWVYPETDSTISSLVAVLLSVYFTAASATGGRLRELARHVIPAGVKGMDFAAPYALRVEIDDVAGDPTMDCYLGPWTSPGGTVYSEVHLFDTEILGGTVTSVDADASVANGTVTDTSANKITATGTIGFACGRDRKKVLTGTAETSLRDGIVSLDAKRLSTGATLLRDEFTRVGFIGEGPNLNGVYLITSSHAKRGSWYQSLWSYGMTAATDNSFAELDPQMIRADATSSYAPLAYAELDMEADSPPAVSNVFPADRDFYAFRPSDYDDAHHRVVEFKMPGQETGNPNYTAQVYRVGIVLRGAAVISVVQTGIAASCFVTTNASGAQAYLDFRLDYRTRNPVDPDGPATNTRLASVIIHSGGSPPAGFDLFDGAFHELAFECYVQTGGTQVGAPSVYKLWLDGTQVVFDTIHPAGSGITIQADGTVIDSSPLAAAGFVEGVFYATQNPETDATGTAVWTPPQIRSWTQGALTLSGGGTDPDTMETIAVSDEGAASPVGDLGTVLEPDFPFTIEYHRRAYRTRFDSGHTYSSPAGQRRRRVFQFRKTGATTAEHDALVSFWNTHEATEIPFNWTPEGESALVGAFLPGTLEVEELSQHVYRLGFDVLELLP